jgi:hypothetical protein
MNLKYIFFVLLITTFVLINGCKLLRSNKSMKEESIANVPGVILKFGSVMYFFADLRYDAQAFDNRKSLENAILSSSKEALILRYFENYSDGYFFCCADTIDLSKILPDWDDSYTNLLVCNARLSARLFEESNNTGTFGVHEIIVDKEPIIVRYSQIEYIIESIKCE